MSKPLYGRREHEHLWAALEDCDGCETGHDPGRHAICSRCDARKVFPRGMLLTRSEQARKFEPPPSHDSSQVSRLIAGIGSN